MTTVKQSPRSNTREPLAGAGRRRVVAVLGALAIGTGFWGMQQKNSPLPSKETAEIATALTPDAQPAVEPPLSPTARQLVGKWQLKDFIQREIDIRPDGTATMNVTLDYLTSLVYGRNLTLNLNWQLKDDLLTHTVTGGTPPANVEKITEAFGKSMSYKLVKVDSDQMVLKGPSGSKSVENWEALKPSAK